MSRSNPRVLLVDDHAEFLGALRELLEERFEIHTAASGAQALALCERHGPFAAVVSDYGMPGMNGIQLLAELRQLWPDTPRILLTGCSDLALAVEALEEGAVFRFLTKPPRPERLLECVTAAVARCHEREEERLLTEQLQFRCESLGELQRALDRRLAHEHAARREHARASDRSLLAALVRLARHRDDETGTHLARVSEYCRFFAGALRTDGHETATIDDDFVRDLGWAAPLHDVGKVAIPDAILFKPGKLDEGEWAIMRTHASIGAEILRGLGAGAGHELLALAEELAWTHHERWDGTGYPRGLAGTAIPLAGRIMAVADCYDALTSERPYKHAWPHEAAVAHLGEQRGRAFDPQLIDSVLARADELAGLLAHGHTLEDAA